MLLRGTIRYPEITALLRYSTDTHYCLNYEDFDFVMLMHLLDEPYHFRGMFCSVLYK